jgi:hypothetical protein
LLPSFFLIVKFFFPGKEEITLVTIMPHQPVNVSFFFLFFNQKNSNDNREKKIQGHMWKNIYQVLFKK